MNPKFLNPLDEVYKSGKLYEYITKYDVGDNLNVNPFRIVLHLERLYSRIDKLEKKLEELEAL